MPIECLLIVFWVVLLPALAIGGLMYRRKLRNGQARMTRRTIVGLVLWAIIFLPCCAFSAAVFYSDMIVVPETNAVVKQNVAVIIAALEKYRVDAGHYPDALDELIPKYLEQIPAHPDYSAYNYERYRDGFVLQYVLPASPPWIAILGVFYCTYQSETKNTSCDD